MDLEGLVIRVLEITIAPCECLKIQHPQTEVMGELEIPALDVLENLGYSDLESGLIVLELLEITTGDCLGLNQAFGCTTRGDMIQGWGWGLERIQSTRCRALAMNMLDIWVGFCTT